MGAYRPSGSAIEDLGMAGIVAVVGKLATHSSCSLHNCSSRPHSRCNMFLKTLPFLGGVSAESSHRFRRMAGSCDGR